MDRPVGMPEAGWIYNGSGYLVKRAKHPITGRLCYQLQHRFFLEEYLGRKLESHENVHHINGVRDDNRLENLELWSTKQPQGQRILDKLDWAREIIAKYQDEQNLHAKLGTSSVRIDTESTEDK